jgi:endonuclease I
MQYRADTKPGSSGAPVLNDQWQLAALHHAGVPKRDAQRRILLTDGNIWNRSDADMHRIAWEANEGVRISAIVSFVDQLNLDADKKALWNECFARPAPSDIWPYLDVPRELRPQAREAEKAGAPESMQHEPDGSVSWYFRLNFGPVGARRNGPARQAGSPRVEAPVGGAGGRPASRADVAGKAKDIFERFQWREDYFDAHADGLDARSYYEEVDWNASPPKIFATLSKLVEKTHTTQPSYGQARVQYFYPAVDLHEDGKLRHIYSGRPFDPVEAIESELSQVAELARLREGMVVATSLEALIERDDLWDAIEERAAAPFNCEHVVPQSWFKRQEPMRGDLHHLFTCETRCNSFRGNTPYWQFSPEAEAIMQECGRREEDKFEPKHGKGPIARATLYFLLRYPGEIGDAQRELRRNRLHVLLDWHRNSQVTTYEKHRNRIIFKVQGNRNPFIDHPESATEMLLTQGFGN